MTQRKELFEWFQDRNGYWERPGTNNGSKFTFDTQWRAWLTANEGKQIGIQLDPNLDDEWMRHLEEQAKNMTDPYQESVALLIDLEATNLENHWHNLVEEQLDDILKKNRVPEANFAEWAQKMRFKPGFSILGRMGRHLCLDGIDHAVGSTWEDGEEFAHMSTGDLQTLKDIILFLDEWFQTKQHEREINRIALDRRAYWEGERKFGETPQGKALQDEAKRIAEELENAKHAFASNHQAQAWRKKDS